MPTLDELRAEMGSYRDTWLELTVPWLASYWRDQARAIVVDQSGHSEKITGSEELRAAKASVEALADRADKELDSRLLGENGPSVCLT